MASAFQKHRLIFIVVMLLVVGAGAAALYPWKPLLERTIKTALQEQGLRNLRLTLSDVNARALTLQNLAWEDSGKKPKPQTLAGITLTYSVWELLTGHLRGLNVNHVSKMVQGLHHICAISEKPFEWIGPVPSIGVKRNPILFSNGILDLETHKLHFHNGDYFATGLPKHNWDPFAECPRWMQFLDETVDPADHKTLQQLFGYCLIPETRAHIFGLFIGRPRSGKSTALTVLEELVGFDLRASSSLADLSGNFGGENLPGKLLLIIPDAHDAPIRNRSTALERIKTITGGDSISINRKNKPILTMSLQTRIILTCNRLPKFLDESGALAQRMVIVRFNNSFRGKEDRLLTHKLRSEASGIANWALKGLEELIKNGFTFTLSDRGKEEVILAQDAQSPAGRFGKARLTITENDDNFTPIKKIYESYHEWVVEEGLKYAEIRSQTDLVHDLIAAFGGIRHTQRRIDGKQTYGFAGVAKASLDLDEEI